MMEVNGALMEMLGKTTPDDSHLKSAAGGRPGGVSAEAIGHFMLSKASNLSLVEEEEVCGTRSYA